ncbi:hypothetical protein JMA_21600 [Jeotgalibacillus malaysiensis]|uniref:Uncharacterized protein n=1 Tax=Jeotgalibacillus malaysiensis TaxID=1508404 RepID=A0A0B5AS01_9BACL|nr:hypothetical protein [Jeotgalibacillus malaysiensis]AJD91477.1 hypothetical protein JMA_21600 [Jeotgalibacillus malaysiensis]
MKNNSINLDTLSTVSPAKMQLYLLAAGISLTLQECTKLQQLLKNNLSLIQSLPQLLNEAEHILGKKKMKELMIRAVSFL